MRAEQKGYNLKDRDSADVLSALGDARKCLVMVKKAMKPRSGLARSADAVISEIDEFAFVLTGVSDYFHLKGHGTPARDPNGCS
ncbi:hypothetical protein FMN50_23185 [Rhodobacterales bacterium]|nr:hypothetical protein FMN50_23185 [Rhodobacterales bacterium]